MYHDTPSFRPIPHYCLPPTMMGMLYDAGELEERLLKGEVAARVRTRGSAAA